MLGDSEDENEENEGEYEEEEQEQEDGGRKKKKVVTKWRNETLFVIKQYCDLWTCDLWTYVFSLFIVVWTCVFFYHFELILWVVTLSCVFFFIMFGVFL